MDSLEAPMHPSLPTAPSLHSLSLVITPPPHVLLHPVHSDHGSHMGHGSVLQVVASVASPGHDWSSPLMHSLERILTPPPHEAEHWEYIPHSLQYGQNPLMQDSVITFMPSGHPSIPMAPLVHVLDFCLVPRPHDTLHIDHSVHTDHDGQACWLQTRSSNLSPTHLVALKSSSAMQVLSLPWTPVPHDLLHGSHMVHSPKYGHACSLQVLILISSPSQVKSA